MPDVYFNKSPKKRPSNDDYEDISSFSSKSAKRRSDVEFQRARARAEAEAYENGYYDDYSEYDERDLKKARKKAKKAAKKEQKANRPRRRGGCGSAFLSLFLILVILYLAMSTVFLARMDYEPGQHKSNSHISSFSLKKSPLITNILLLGVDNREGETGFQRADTMMLISIDNLHQKIKFTSFLRDSYVEIPGHGMMKLNAASSLGGIQLTIDTIEYNYKVKINKYMEVDFNAFTAIIDALGGVDVPVTAKEAAYLNSTWYKWSLTPASGNWTPTSSGPAASVSSSTPSDRKPPTRSLPTSRKPRGTSFPTCAPTWAASRLRTSRSALCCSIVTMTSCRRRPRGRTPGPTATSPMSARSSTSMSTRMPPS